MTTNKEAIAAALFAALVAVTPAANGVQPTPAGSFDPLFGPDKTGRIVHNYATSYDYATRIFVLADGKYLVTGYGYNSVDEFSMGFVTRYNGDGTHDASFYGGGRRIYGTASDDRTVSASTPLSNGRIVVGGNTYFRSSGRSEAWLTQLKPDGSTDTDFGSGGIVQMAAMAPLERMGFRAVTAGANGTLYVSGSAFMKDGTDYRAFVLRLLANGAPDSSFGAGGFAWLHGVANDFHGDRIHVSASGAITLSGYTIDAQNKLADYRGVVMRLNADGTPDVGFGGGGKYTLAGDGGGSDFNGMVIDPDGSMMLAGTTFGSARKAYLIRLTGSGQPDPAFGAGGRLLLPAFANYAEDLVRQPDGRWVVGFATVTNQTWRAGVLRLLADGQLDTSFGNGGFATEFGFDESQVFALAVDVDGKILMGGMTSPSAAPDDSFVARMIGTEITTQVVEFHNTLLDHYFVTAEPNEAAAIDAGAAGPGWLRTGRTFNSGGPNRVCRFYGNPENDPATGARRGPNSHFYTIEQTECAMVKTDAGWKFESHDFNAWPLADGACPTGTLAIKRTYNRKFMQNDSNHRYVTSEHDYQQMLQLGWAGEGTVFCAPQ